MKIKMLLALGLSGLLMTSFSFAASMDGMEDSTADLQTIADATSNNANGAMQNPAGDITSNNVGSMNAPAPSAANPSDMPNAGPNGDDMSADTATGDDDY